MNAHEMADVLAITRTIQEVGLAFDRKLHDALLPRLFTSDARILYLLSGALTDFSMPDGIAHFKRFHERCYWTQHLVSPPVVDLEGDMARAVSQVHAVHVQVRTDGSRNTWTVGASYHDTLVRTPAGWRIAERRVPCPYDDGAFEADGVQLFSEAPALP
jgi:hypothetical protein